ncbi:thioesterase superfamily protein [Fictibacillus macauensis ZFHKF-1]|uniref:Thioesterase superfamily protein n=1 Tax=Fictibacillus macauensis ZFHKF-1 TaxID=1196324 RepID=I8AM41_9BACL|nr:thioesterase family protein [Fictibacillus macauensis]EIT86734.1 thioesterase superfamily protein [Fictibacillus macauensis ZFHKF-1]
MHEDMLRVRFSETDMLGHVNNTSYFIYFEEARIRYIEALGFTVDPTEWNFILASSKCDFLQQAYFNDALKVRTFASKVGTKSMQLEHEIFSVENEALVAKGYSVLVFFEVKKQQTAPIPESLKQALEADMLAQKEEEVS